MEKLTVERGTVISAAMLGALAGLGALPFERSGYEAIVREGARGAKASLAAFADAFDRSRPGEREAPEEGTPEAHAPEGGTAQSSERTRKRFSRPLSRENMPPRPGITSMTMSVCFQASYCEPLM